jgi:hypothetical protein
MHRLLRELDRRDLEASDFIPPDRQPRTGGRLRGVIALLVFIAVAGGIAYGLGLGRSTKHHPVDALLFAPRGHSDVFTDAGHAALGVQLPPAGVGERAKPLGTPPHPPAGAGGYAFVHVVQGKPVAYDPCRPIHYVIRDQGTPTGGDAAIHRAIAAVSQATGLTFIDDGLTGEAPSKSRAAYQPERYGQRWAPVLIAWSDDKETPRLAGPVVGLGGSVAYERSPETGQVYVTGGVTLDAPELSAIEPSRRTAAITAVVEHELGHVAGLDHVQDPSALMYPEEHGQTGYGPGDLRGLALLGSGSCHPEL